MIRFIRCCLAIAAAFAALGSQAFPLPPPTAAVTEFVNDITGHFFLASELFETNFILTGGAGPGWHRTGYSFGAYPTGSSSGVDVCRFYAPSPNTHFYTASADECQALTLHPEWGWISEGVHFRASVPVEGSCNGTDSIPIHRLYNNRFQFNDSSHRYVFDDKVRADMVAQGWTDEGVVFCSASASVAPSQVFTVGTKDIRGVADCENEDVTQGACIAMNALPESLPNKIVAHEPPTFSAPGPGWSLAFGDLTGFHDADVFTAMPIEDTQAVLTHSFVQQGTVPVTLQGVHVISTDARQPLASIEPMYQFSTRAPAAGAVDRRVFPWRAREASMRIFFGVTVKTALRNDPSSHVYGTPMIEFRDVRSGDAIDVTMLTYATFPPGDFVGQKDPVTGNVIVSTSFTPKTTFGTRIRGDFIALANGPAPTQDTVYEFGITSADFAKIIAMAQATNPALSPDVNDYLLVNFRFRNGILGNAELGATLADLQLSLFGF